jgi:hypothetical protein
MTTTKKTTTAPVEETVGKGGNFVLRTLRGGMGALETGTMSVAELPLTVLSGLGVPKGATDAARKGSRSMLHGVNGTIDTLATQTFKIAGKGASLVTGAAGVGRS